MEIALVPCEIFPALLPIAIAELLCVCKPAEFPIAIEPLH